MQGWTSQNWLCCCTMLLATVLVGNVSAQDSGVLVANGLNGPMGVLVMEDGRVLVVDSGNGGEVVAEAPHPVTGEVVKIGIGESSRIFSIAENGEQTTVQMLPSVMFDPTNVFGGGRLAAIGEDLYVTSGAWDSHAGNDRSPFSAAIVRIRGGERTEIANTWDLERDQNPDGATLIETNPYGLTAGPDGNLWMTDAAMNTLLRVEPESGKLDLVAVFDPVPSPLPRESRGGAMVTDPVPTAVAFDDEGNAYVSLLPGFPLLPGTGQVVRVLPDGSVQPYATNLTMPTDLRRGPDGNFYTVSFARFTEQGPEPNSGALVRIREGADSEVVISGLAFPTSVDFNAAGDAYVSINGGGPPGAGEIRKFAAVAARK